MNYRACIRTLAVCALLAGAALNTASAQQIVQTRGVDSRVDYASLLRFGPWDDRNYSLTQDDLRLLADNEEDLGIQVPLFFRVEMRKRFPEMQKTGPVQYPRSALQKFRINYGGFLIDGKIYNRVERRDGRLAVKMTDGVEEKAYRAEQQRFLDGEVRITSPNGAAESAIKISPADPNVVVAGVNGPFGGQDMYWSNDGGETWSESAALPQGNTCCDPTIDYSADGSFVYTATLPGGFGTDGVFFYRSDDAGRTWDDLSNGGRRVVGTGGTDKEFVHSDKHPTSPFVDNVYLTWHTGNQMQFGRSSDFGDSWQVQQVSSGNNELGIGSDIATDKSGNVYYFWPAFNSQRILVRKSVNGGQSFQPTREIADTEGRFIFPIPSFDTREVFIYVSADVDLSNGPFANSIYAAWTDSTSSTGGNPDNNHARIQVAYSRDGGDSWNVTTPHEVIDENQVDRFHQWLAVAPDGSVHVIYYDTRRGDRTSVDLFYSMSNDGAQTWSAPERITSELSPKIDDGFEWGDYNGADAVLDDLIAIYTDNRNENGGGSDSVDVYAIGVPLDGGGGGELQLSQPVPGQAGVDNVLTVTGGSAGGEAYLLFSRSTGSTDIPMCPGTVGLDSPRIIGQETVDGSGQAEFTVAVPDAASGGTALFAAVDADGCLISNTVTFTFP